MTDGTSGCAQIRDWIWKARALATNGSRGPRTDGTVPAGGAAEMAATYWTVRYSRGAVAGQPSLGFLLSAGGYDNT